MSKIKYMPQCISDHVKGDAVCDGDPKGATDYERTPCAMRDACLSFQLHLKERGESVEQHIDFVPVQEGGREATKAVAKVPAQFASITEAAKKRYGVKAGEATRQPKRGVEVPKKRRKPTKKAQRKARRALEKMARTRHHELRKLFEHFKALVKEQVPNKMAKRAHAIAPGDLYIVDRTDKSDYITIYCRTRSGRDAPLVLAKFKPRQMALDIEVPVTPEVIEEFVGKTTLKKLAPRHYSDGRFLSKLPNLDREGLGLAAEAIGKLVGSGRIILPAA